MTYTHSNHVMQRVIDSLERNKTHSIPVQIHIINEVMNELLTESNEEKNEAKTLTGVHDACHALLDIFLAICDPKYIPKEQFKLTIETARHLFAIMYHLIHMTAKDETNAHDKDIIAKLISLLDLQNIKSIEWAEVLPQLEQHGAETILSKVRFQNFEFGSFFRIASNGYFTSPAMMQEYKSGHYETIASDGLWKGDSYEDRKGFFTKLLVPTMPVNMSNMRKQLIDLSWDGYHKGMSYHDLKNYLQQVIHTADSYKPGWRHPLCSTFQTADTIAILAKVVEDLNPVSADLRASLNLKAPVAANDTAHEVRFRLNR